MSKKVCTDCKNLHLTDIWIDDETGLEMRFKCPNNDENVQKGFNICEHFK